MSSDDGVNWIALRDAVKAAASYRQRHSGGSEAESCCGAVDTIMSLLAAGEIVARTVYPEDYDHQTFKLHGGACRVALATGNVIPRLFWTDWRRACGDAGKVDWLYSNIRFRTFDATAGNGKIYTSLTSPADIWRGKAMPLIHGRAQGIEIPKDNLNRITEPQDWRTGGPDPAQDSRLTDLAVLTSSVYSKQQDKMLGAASSGGVSQGAAHRPSKIGRPNSRDEAMAIHRCRLAKNEDIKNTTQEARAIHAIMAERYKSDLRWKYQPASIARALREIRRTPTLD